jgi:hypothetical protein
MRQGPTASDKAGSLDRRSFLSKAGSTALAVPVTTSLVVSASVTPAVAKSPYGKSGHGNGHKPKSDGYKNKEFKATKR